MLQEIPAASLLFYLFIFLALVLKPMVPIEYASKVNQYSTRLNPSFPKPSPKCGRPPFCVHDNLRDASLYPIIDAGILINGKLLRVISDVLPLFPMQKLDDVQQEFVDRCFIA